MDETTEQKRRAREQKNYRSADLSATDSPAAGVEYKPPSVATRTFQQMIGAGDVLVIEGVGEYDMKPYPMRVLSRAGGLLKEGPALYLAQALLPEQDQEDHGMIADKINQLFNKTKDSEGYYLPSTVEREMLYVMQNLSSDKIEPLLECIVMSIQLTHKDLSIDQIEEIKDAIDHPTLIAGMRLILQLNSGLARRF